MLGHLSILNYSQEDESEKVQVQTISREVVLDSDRCQGLTPQRLHASPWESAAALRQEVARAYLLGAFKDGTFNRLHRTFRFSQKEREWLERLQQLLANLGYRAWIYREGQQRHLYVLETTARCLAGAFQPMRSDDGEEEIAYVRGYFDAEGGIPQRTDVPLYVQFVQKDFASLTQVKEILEERGIECGVIHNPSQRIDPGYWRFFVRRASHQRFIQMVGSWHPRKAALLRQRVKI